LRPSLVPLLLLAACAGTAPEPADVSATREDVTASLYRQLELVLARQEELASEVGPQAERERQELLRLAAEIAIRIVRIDPEADGRVLVDRIDGAR
jgi:hypothetical protein